MNYCRNFSKEYIENAHFWDDHISEVADLVGSEDQVKANIEDSYS